MEAIYATDSEGGLSRDGKLPWISKKDMKFFLDKTKHHAVVMGRNTFFSLPENARPLKNRLNIVLTSEPAKYAGLYTAAGNLIFMNEFVKDDAWATKYPFLCENWKVIIIGGKSVYEKYIPLCETVWMTQLKQDYLCDCIMNYDYSAEKWAQEIIEEDDELVIYKYRRGSRHNIFKII